MRCVGAAVLAALLGSVAVVLALRVVPPPATAMMIEQPGRLHDVIYAWRDRAHISSSVARAFIASEDQRFLQHHGFDFESMQRALDNYEAGESLRGASTISQQVAKNLFLWSGRSFVRKGLEAWFAVLIEALWPKERTLEIYLNIAQFGKGIYGVEAASQRFWRHPASRLSSPEAAL